MDQRLVVSDPFEEERNRGIDLAVALDYGSHDAVEFSSVFRWTESLQAFVSSLAYPPPLEPDDGSLACGKNAGQRLQLPVHCYHSFTTPTHLRGELLSGEVKLQGLRSRVLSVRNAGQMTIGPMIANVVLVVLAAVFIALSAEMAIHRLF